MAAILDLPDELLFWILSALWSVLGRIEATTLTLVCKRFHRLVTPLLYSNIWIQYTAASNDEGASIRRAKLLHRTFRSNQYLRQHCREFRIVLGSPWPSPQVTNIREPPTRDPIDIAMDLFHWLTNTTKLYIECWPQNSVYWDQVTPGLPDISLLMSLASQNLLQLKTIEAFGGYDATLNLPLIVTGLSDLRPGASLRTLDLSGVSQLGDAQDWEILRNNAGTAPFTELILRHFTHSSQALEALIMWPAKLESFTFSMPKSDNYSGHSALTTYTLGTMQTVLSHQKDWLSYIRIYELLTQGLFDFELSGFCQLRTLWLSHDLTGTDAVSVANLVAPNLEVFYWDMALEHQTRHVTLEAFTQPEEDWLRGFAFAAIERGSALKRIEIKFCPDARFQAKTCEAVEYPWDRMDRIAHEIQPHGINLVYDPPSTTRDEVLEALKEG